MSQQPRSVFGNMSAATITIFVIAIIIIAAIAWKTMK